MSRRREPNKVDPMVDAEFAAEYQRHYSLLLGIARSCTHGRIDPEDIVQTTVENVYRKTITGEYNVSSFRYIATTAIPREAIKALAKQATASRTTARYERETDKATNGPEGTVEERESIAGIETAIEKVIEDIENNKRSDARPDVDKQVLALLVRSRHPFEEANELARRVGLPKAGVIQRMARLRRKLQKALGNVPTWRAV